jgi:hypothetical protein
MQKMNIYEVLTQFNQIHPKLQFTLEEEADHHIHFLNVTIIRKNNNIQFNIFQKPTTTDAIIPQESCHPDEHKTSAIRFLRNRNATYLTTPDSKQRETEIFNHILQANNCSRSFCSNKKPPAKKTNNRNPDQEVGQVYVRGKGSLIHYKYNHPSYPIQETMVIIHTTGKGTMLNVIEKYYIYIEAANNNQLNDRLTVMSNAIFDTLLRSLDARNALH